MNSADLTVYELGKSSKMTSTDAQILGYFATIFHSFRNTQFINEKKKLFPLDSFFFLFTQPKFYSILGVSIDKFLESLY